VPRALTTEIPIPESHKRALDAALDDLQRNPDAGEIWEDVKKDLSRRYPQNDRAAVDLRPSGGIAADET